MNDDLHLLASAYLDGDVTPAERAQVEDNPDLTREVEQLRLVRATLADDEPPMISMRERHLAGALDAWDRLPDVELIAAVRDQTPAGVDAAAAVGASTLIAPPASSLAARRRNRNRTWTLAAAAGLIVVLGGGIVLNGRNRGTNDDNSASEPQVGAAADQSVDGEFDLAEERSVEAGADVAGTDSPIAQLPDAAPLEAEVASDEPSGGAEAAPPETEGLVDLVSPDDLIAFASGALDATSSPLDTSAAADDSTSGDAVEGFDVQQCPGIDTVVGPATYQGVLVVVGIDEDNRQVVAHTLDCVEIARAALP
jgi:hypothetical protein